MALASTRLALSLGAAALLAPAIASADADPDAAKNPRLGFYGGVALHAGNISCDGDNCGDFREAGGADGHVGFLVNDKLGVHLDLWGMTSKENDVTITFAAATAGVRYWVVPIIWLQAGLGVGHASVKYDGIFGTFETVTDDVPVLQLGAGIEVVRGKRFALDVEAKIAWGTSTDDDDNRESTGRMAGLGVGITFF